MANNKPKPIPELTVQQIATFWSRVEKLGPDDCWLWKRGRTNKQYGIYAPQHGVNLRTHRVAFKLHYGYTAMPETLHKCDNPPCCNPAHLFEGTTQDNAIDRSIKGRGHQGDKHWSRTSPEKVKRGDDNVMRRRPDLVRRGVAHHKALLTEDQVSAIRSRNAAGESMKNLGIEYGVTISAIWRIVHRLSWTHVV